MTDNGTSSAARKKRPLRTAFISPHTFTASRLEHPKAGTPRPKEANDVKPHTLPERGTRMDALGEGFNREGPVSLQACQGCYGELRGPMSCSGSFEPVPSEASGEKMLKSCNPWEI